MIKINNYILEKLHLNKDTKLDVPTEEMFINTLKDYIEASDKTYLKLDDIYKWEDNDYPLRNYVFHIQSMWDNGDEIRYTTSGSKVYTLNYEDELTDEQKKKIYNHMIGVLNKTITEKLHLSKDTKYNDIADINPKSIAIMLKISKDDMSLNVKKIYIEDINDDTITYFQYKYANPRNMGSIKHESNILKEYKKYTFIENSYIKVILSVKKGLKLIDDILDLIQNESAEWYSLSKLDYKKYTDYPITKPSELYILNADYDNIELIKKDLE